MMTAYARNRLVERSKPRFYPQKTSKINSFWYRTRYPAIGAGADFMRFSACEAPLELGFAAFLARLAIKSVKSALVGDFGCNSCRNPSLSRKRENLVRGHHQMIQQPDVDQGERALQHARQPAVVCAQLDAAGGVIMRDDQAGR